MKERQKKMNVKHSMESGAFIAMRRDLHLHFKSLESS